MMSTYKLGPTVPDPSLHLCNGNLATATNMLGLRDACEAKSFIEHTSHDHHI